jgi:hypothetical protein
MIDEIKSNRVRKVNNALNHGNIQEDELNLMAEFEDAELAEFLFLIEQGIISHNILAYYFVVYNKSRMKTIEKDYKYQFINGLLASAWTDSYQNQDADTMVDMLLGLSFINTDLLSRIRAGLKLNSKKLNAFDIKVEEILKVLMERAENGTLYRTLTSVDQPDHSALSDDDNISFLNIKEDLDNISNVFEIYEINHGNFKNKEYLSKDPKKLAKYEEDLRTEIKAYFNLDELNRRFSYLPEYYKEVILGALTGNNNVKKTEDKVFGKNTKSGKGKDKKEKDLLDSLSTVERDEVELEPVLNTSEDKVFGAFDRIVNTKKKEKVSDNNDKPIGVHDILVGLEEKRTSSNFSVLFKIVIALLAVMALIGWGLSVRSNNTDGSDHVKDLTYQEILSYKISSGGDAKYDMKINRSNTNTGDIGNGAVKESIPNVE